MNISTETINALNELGYTFTFCDNNSNQVDQTIADNMQFGFKMESKNEMIYLGKTIKSTKKETTLDYILSKLETDKIFKNFSDHFNNIVKHYGLNAYPTSYGIGIFVAVAFRKDVNETKIKIESLLNNLNVKYTTEYSEAGWVFRYRISKSKENISLIDSLIM